MQELLKINLIQIIITGIKLYNDVTLWLDFVYMICLFGYNSFNSYI